MKKKLRVGFDFDGVIAYNPLRTVRLPISLFGRLFGKEDSVVTYFPKSKFEQALWILIHETSFFPSVGFDKLQILLKDDTVECYILTSRYACLESSFYRWLKKHKIDRSFKGYYLNKKNELPHKFKERIIRKLNLDYYVDDNWGIVDYLNGKTVSSKNKNREVTSERNDYLHTEIHWIYNILERSNPYKRKHPYLGKFVDVIREKKQKK